MLALNKKFKKEIGWIIKEKYNNNFRNKNIGKDIIRLKNNEPIDYIIGFSEFCGVRIDLKLKPLIPRPETEYWVLSAIQEIKNKKKLKLIKCLDIFAGSGCIGIAILKNIQNSIVDFADIEERFLKQIRFNLKINKIAKSRYNIIKSDLFSNVNRKYNYIFANPPYISEKRVNSVQKSVLDYEPHKALLAKDYGLFYIKEFLSQAKEFLNKNGKIYLEFSPGQKAEVKKIIIKENYKNFIFKKDQYSRFRVVKITI